MSDIRATMKHGEACRRATWRAYPTELLEAHLEHPELTIEGRQAIARNVAGLDGGAGSVSDADLDRLASGAKKANKAIAVFVDGGQTREVPALQALPVVRAAFNRARAAVQDFERLTRTDPAAALARGLATPALLRACDEVTLNALVTAAQGRPEAAALAGHLVRQCNEPDSGRRASVAALVRMVASFDPVVVGDAVAQLSGPGLRRIASIDGETRNLLTASVLVLPATHPNRSRFLELVALGG